jgi:nitrate/nitrite transport system permease protein
MIFTALTLILLALLIVAAYCAGKHRTVRALDIAGLNFLTPVVRLCYREEPEKQLREITRFIVVPGVAVVAFLLAWQAVSDRVQTKSGKLPSPSETIRSAASILEFHDRENDKQRAFNLDGDAREKELLRIETRLAELDPLVAESNAKVDEAQVNALAQVEKRVTPLQKKYDTLATEYKSALKQREAALESLATQVAAGDAQAKEVYVAEVRAHRERTKVEREELRQLRATIMAVRGAKDTELVQALAAQTLLAEERQFLTKMRDQLTSANRHAKLDAETDRLAQARETLYAANETELFEAATQVALTEDRIAKMTTSGYAKPATLPYQVARSVLCVFVGFLLGSLIAIPLGVLCGLSKTFMAAMTPFIAIFKPVSPIVWLPVALILASSLIPDPDKHWFTQWMWHLPFLGEYKINPAFLASAVTVALCSLWATLVNTAFGVASVDQDHMNVARVLRLGFWSRLFKIVLPSALPLVFAGLRISLGVGWMVLIAAELLSSSEGIGKFVWDQFNNGASDSFAKMVVVVFVVGLIGLALDRMMVVLQRLVSFDGAPTAI